MESRSMGFHTLILTEVAGSIHWRQGRSSQTSSWPKNISVAYPNGRNESYFAERRFGLFDLILTMPSSFRRRGH